MLKVPLHLTRDLPGLSVLLRSFSILLLARTVSAQYLVNGQVFTYALAIVDAPAPNGTFHAGSSIPIAIDVSGDGKLPQAAAAPGAGLATGFDSLELYLVSEQTKTNLTISNGTGLLTQEPESTVKHINFVLSNCVTPGNYNFTVYEGSHINGQNYFSITPVPISIENTSPSGPCTNGTNQLQDLPQPNSPPPANPFLNTSGLAPLDASSSSAATSCTPSLQAPLAFFSLALLSMMFAI
ncbi:hypothetical protein BC834DRAFT_848968 [Gloeopeniophorella convolvens]|nr:hypothetical protein BC834DRAFT_848968 [Gloeopeniophorella convolvens]